MVSYPDVAMRLEITPAPEGSSMYDKDRAREIIKDFIETHPARWLETPYGYRLSFGDLYTITVEHWFYGIVEVGVQTPKGDMHDESYACYFIPNPGYYSPILDRIGTAASDIIQQYKLVDLPDWLAEPTAKAFEVKATQMSDMALKIRQAQVSEV